jgi:hypothetical protein
MVYWEKIVGSRETQNSSRDTEVEAAGRGERCWKQNANSEISRKCNVKNRRSVFWGSCTDWGLIEKVCVCVFYLEAEAQKPGDMDDPDMLFKSERVGRKRENLTNRTVN